MDTILPVLISAGLVFFVIFNLGNQRRGHGMPRVREHHSERRRAWSGPTGERTERGGVIAGDRGATDPAR